MGVQFISLLFYFEKKKHPHILFHNKSWYGILIHGERAAQRWGHLSRIHWADLTILALCRNRCPIPEHISQPVVRKKKQITYWMSSYDGTMLFHCFLLHTPSSPKGHILQKSRQMGNPRYCWSVSRCAYTWEILQAWMWSPRAWEAVHPTWLTTQPKQCCFGEWGCLNRWHVPLLLQTFLKCMGEIE